MLRSVTGAFAAVAALGGLAMSSAPAGAMPMVDAGPAVVAHAAAGAAVQDVRWVCGPFRCFWRPNSYPVYGGGYGWHRPYGYGFHGGWHGGYHRWHRW